MNRSGRSVPAGPATTPHASSGWSRRACATIASWMSWLILSTAARLTISGGWCDRRRLVGAGEDRGRRLDRRPQLADQRDRAMRVHAGYDGVAGTVVLADGEAQVAVGTTGGERVGDRIDVAALDS